MSPEPQKAVRRQQLGKIVAISRKMLACIKTEDWDQLVLLESERCHLLNEFFQVPVDESESSDVALAIRLIQTLDKKTMQHVQVEHKTVSDELKKLNKGRRVNNAYLQ